MNLKKKLIGTIGIVVVAMTMFFNTNAMNSSNSDLDLASLVTINTASAECETGGLPNKCCPYWNVTITWTFTGPQISCSTGGQFKCKDC